LDVRERKYHEDRKNDIMMSFRFVLLTKYCYGYKTKEDEMDGTFCMYGRSEQCMHNFSGNI